MRAFLLTAEEVAALDAARDAFLPSMPGVQLPPPEERVRVIWERLAHRHGFDPSTVRETVDRRLVYAEAVE